MSRQLDASGLGTARLDVGEDSAFGVARRRHDEGALREREGARKATDERDHDLIRLQHGPRLRNEILKRLANLGLVWGASGSLAVPNPRL